MILLKKITKTHLCSSIISFTSGFKVEFWIHCHIIVITHTVIFLLYSCRWFIYSYLAIKFPLEIKVSLTRVSWPRRQRHMAQNKWYLEFTNNSNKTAAIQIQVWIWEVSCSFACQKKKKVLLVSILSSLDIPHCHLTANRWSKYFILKIFLQRQKSKCHYWVSACMRCKNPKRSLFFFSPPSRSFWEGLDAHRFGIDI